MLLLTHSGGTHIKQLASFTKYLIGPKARTLLLQMSTHTHDPQHVKKGLRKTVDEALKARDATDIHRESEAICSRAADYPAFESSGTIAAFLSMPHEVGTNALIKVACDTNKTVLVPRVSGKNSVDMEMLPLAGYDEIVRLVKDRWGIPTPGPAYSGTEVPRPVWPLLPPGSAPLSLVFVPGVAFDVQGRRLGHGKGYYGERSSYGQQMRPAQFTSQQREIKYDCGFIDQYFAPADAFLNRVIAAWNNAGQPVGSKPFFVVSGC